MTSPLLGVGLLAAMPIFLGLYYRLVMRVSDALPSVRFERKHGAIVYLGFVYAAAGVFVLVVPVAPAIDFSLPSVGAVGVGVVAYWAHVKLRLYRSDEREWTRQRRDPRWLLPVLLTPVPEEVLYRAGLESIVPVVGPVGFVVVSSLLFGLHHVYDGRREVRNKASLGVLFCVLYLSTGTIVAPIAAHVGYNGAFVRYSATAVTDTGVPAR